jgi:tape measure domain-containing protein
MAIELATAYISIVPETKDLEAGIKKALNSASKNADTVGADIGSKMAAGASKSLKSGWRPDMDIMAGIPDTKADRIGARVGQVIGKGISSGIKARQLGLDFGNSFASGAGSVGIGRVVSGWRSDLSNQSNKLGFLAGKALSAGVTAAVGVGVAGVGLALTKGFDRLVVIDTAKQKLKNLGKSAEEVAKISQMVVDSVTGTPFSMDAAFTTATKAIGTGVEDIERFMKNVADAAGFAGTDLERMGDIFNQVQLKGKVTGDEMMRLIDAGLPAKSWIQKSYDLTADQLEKMQEDGQITLDMLQKSIEDFAPGMAKGLGDTLQGSIDNMQTAIARVGANFLSAIFGGDSGDPTEGMKDAVQRITEMLNNLDQWIKTNKDSIRQFFVSAKDAAGMLLDVLGNIASALREHPELIAAAVLAFAAFKTLTAVAAVATSLGAINTALRVMPLAATAALGPLAALAAALTAAGTAAYFLGTAGDSPFPGVGTPGDPTGERGLGNRRTGTGTRGVPSMVDDPIFDGGPPILGGGGSFESGRPSGSRGGRTTLGGNPIGTAGRGYFNSRAASAQLDDMALLSNVPSGRYAQVQAADLTQGLGDCTSAIEDLINIIDGVSTAGRTMSTANAAEFLQSRGFMPGTAPGAFNVGFNANHMQATLPGGTNFNYGSNAAAARRGIGGTGAFDPALTQRYFRYAMGGDVRGPGSAMSDSIPALLSDGEHVLTASDVQAMGGQGGVYDFRKTLHMAAGGSAFGDKIRKTDKTGPGQEGQDRNPFSDDTGIGLQPGFGFGITGGGDLPINLPWWVRGGMPGNRTKSQQRIKMFARGGSVGRKRLEDMRTAGAMPAAAGNTAPVGNSTISSFIDMGGRIPQRHHRPGCVSGSDRSIRGGDGRIVWHRRPGWRASRWGCRRDCYRIGHRCGQARRHLRIRPARYSRRLSAGTSHPVRAAPIP